MNLIVNFSEHSELDVAISPLGPFFFAWANAGETFDANIHAKNDDNIFSITMDQAEGSFATLAIQVRNPRIGLLAPGRKVWAFLSWRNDVGTIVPLFYGRLVGLPEQLQDEVVEISLIARPDNFIDQKMVLANEIKEYGPWDSIWFSGAALNDPDKIIEAMPALFDTDRVTLQVRLTNISVGEEGTENFSEFDVFYDSVHMTMASNPIRKVQMSADVSWDQSAAGTIDLTHFRMNGNDRSGEHSGTITSWFGEGLTQDWPRTGGSIGGGWKWEEASVTVLQGPIDQSIVGQWTLNDLNQSFYMDGGFDTKLGDTGQSTFGIEIGWAYHVAIPLWIFNYTLVLGYDVTRRKAETLVFTLEADVQPTVTEPDDLETLALTMSSSEVVSQGAIAPHGRSFFTTARGTQSIEYLLAIARSHLIARARAVDIQFDISFPAAVAANINCRKNASFPDNRLPGGFVSGKITHYTLTFQDGIANATIHIGCMVGKGGTVTPSVGEPDYIDADYIEDDYQVFLNNFVLPATGDVSYVSIEGLAPVDDGIDFDRISAGTVVRSLRLVNNQNDNDVNQEGALARFNVVVDNNGRIKSAVTDPPPTVRVQLVDLTSGPFATEYDLVTSPLMIAKTIDLEAGAYE